MFHALKKVLKDAGCPPRSATSAIRAGPAQQFEALDTILEAIGKAGYTPARDILLGLDVASSEFFENGKDNLTGEGRSACQSEQFTDFLADWCAQYPIVTIEDGMAEDDWAGWKLLTERPATRCSWSATTCSSPTRRSSTRASSSAWPTRS